MASQLIDRMCSNGRWPGDEALFKANKEAKFVMASGSSTHEAVLRSNVSADYVIF
jgi:hypothetical protein